MLRLQRLCAVLSFGLCLLLLLAPGLGAQTSTTGSINGAISDASGASIPNAKLTLTNIANGAVQTGASSINGSFQFALLNPGTYELSVSATGFAPLQQKLTVSLGQVTPANLKLSVSGQAQSVTVTSEAPLVQTEGSNVSATISAKQVESLPNPGNDLTYLVNLTPGATAMGTVNGLSETLYTMDGMDNEDPYYNAPNTGASNMMLGTIEVQDATVVSNGYSGQYGGLSGANVNYVTKGGTNQYHGDAIWNWTGRVLTANDFFNNAQGSIAPGQDNNPRPFVNVNQWAADFGAPIQKNKLFYYINTTGMNGLAGGSTLTDIPSPQFETATLANLTANGLTASLPFYQNMFKLYNAAPGASAATSGAFPGDTSGGCNGFIGANGLGTTVPCALNFRSNAPSQLHEWTLVGRVDDNISASDRAFFRFETDHGLQPSTIDPINPLFNAYSSQPSYSGQLNETHAFGATAVNNVIVSGSWYGAQFGPTDLPATLALFPTELDFSDGAFSTLGGSDYTFPIGRNVTQLQVSDDYVRYIGNHQLKVGIKYRQNNINDGYFGRFANGDITADIASFFAGGVYNSAGNPPDSATYSQSFAPRSNEPMREWQLGEYVEDDWRVSPTFTLNAALRLDHTSQINCLTNCFSHTAAPFPALNHSASVPYNQAVLAGQSTPLNSLQSLQWQPRVGFAWQPFGTAANTVVRGGYGLFYDTFPAVVMDIYGLNAPVVNSFNVSGDNLAFSESSNMKADATAVNQAFVSGFGSGQTEAQIRASMPANLQQFFVSPGIASSPTKTDVPRVQKWNIEVQKGIGANMALDVNYVGNHGSHLPYPNAGLNAWAPSFPGLPAAAPDTRFGKVYYLETNGYSNYNGLTSTFKLRAAGGLFQASYTWSHALDTISRNLSRSTTAGDDISAAIDPYNPLADYSNSADDVRHNFGLNYVYTTHAPQFYLAGWTLSGTLFTTSGFPYSVFDKRATGKLIASNYGDTLAANFLGGATATCSSPNAPCLAKSQFGPTVGFFNDRNQFRGPGYFNTDLSLTKAVKVPGWEQANFNFGAQFFNLLNHTNFSNPTNNLASSSFGKIQSDVGLPSSIVGAVGGDSAPRTIEVLLKLSF